MTTRRASTLARLALAPLTLAAVMVAGCGAVPTTATVAGPQPVDMGTTAPALSTPLVPTSFDVPRLGIAGAPLIRLGIDAHGALEVPPVSAPMQAGVWVKNGATSTTPTVIVAHVNGGGQRGLFHALTSMVPGDLIVVHRGPGTARYRVGSRIEVDKRHFPTETVFGDQPTATLRLITCGGVLDTAAHNYLANEVVLADRVEE